MSYIPPFTVSAEAINLIAEISAQIERYAIRLEQEDGLRLRKANRIKTIHSSLAIEGNTLSEEEVHDVLDGKKSLILGKLHPLFEHLPVENMVYSNQQQYYDAITASTNAGQSGPFIDFMLGEIYKTLKQHQGNPLSNTADEFDAKFGKEFGVKYGVKFGVNEKKVLLLLASNPSLSAGDLAAQIGLSQRGIEKQLKKFRDLGIITRKGSDKTGYWDFVKE